MANEPILTPEAAYGFLFHEGLHEGETQAEFDERVKAQNDYIMAMAQHVKETILAPKKPLLDRLLKSNGYTK